MKRLIVLAVCLWAIPAAAQQPKPSVNEQALGAKLMEEVGTNVQYRAALIEAQAKLAADDAKMKEMQAELDKLKKK